jgi:transposase InsO family protein
MSKKGCTPDNAACEGFFGTLKTEMFYGVSWEGVSVEEFIQELDSFIKWYNEQRIKMRLGGMSAIVNINLIHWPSKSDPLALA